MASIALRQYPIDKIPIKLSAHNYLVLYDNQGNLVAELHGLAQDPVTGGYKEFGRSSDYLRGVPYDVRAGETSGLNQLGQNERVLWQGPGTAERWQAANDALDAINRRGLTYNFSGGDLNGPRDWDSPAPPVIAGNGNSVNRTLIDAMGLEVPSMPRMAPGTENPLLSQNEIDAIRARNGFPRPPRGWLF